MEGTEAAKAGSKKPGGSKKPAAKRAARKGGGADSEGFTSGDTNPNIRPEQVGASKRRASAQEDLPGMEDRRIKELHEAALEYAGIRDERMRLNEEEGRLKDKLIQLMKKHKKEEYNCEGVKIIFEHVEEDKLKVKVPKADEGGDESD